MRSDLYTAPPRDTVRPQTQAPDGRPHQIGGCKTMRLGEGWLESCSDIWSLGTEPPQFVSPSLGRGNQTHPATPGAVRKHTPLFQLIYVAARSSHSTLSLAAFVTPLLLSSRKRPRKIFIFRIQPRTPDASERPELYPEERKHPLDCHRSPLNEFTYTLPHHTQLCQYLHATFIS